jgi:hypothetical protein
MTAQATPFGEEDRRAMGKLKLFSILYLLVIGAGFVVGFGANVFTFASAFHSSTVGGATTISSVNGILTLVAVSVVVTGAIEVIGLLQLRSAFRSLSKVDPQRFRTPSKFTTLTIVSLPVLFIAFAIILVGLSSMASDNGTLTNSQLLSSEGFDYLIAGGLLAVVFSIVLIVGIAVGPVVGLWRVGERYDADTIKAGAIMFIIPLVQIAAPILVLVGLNNVSMNLEATGKAQG